MTFDEYKKEFPRDSVFVQVDDVTRIMTEDEYESWVADCVWWLNNKPEVL